MPSTSVCLKLRRQSSKTARFQRLHAYFQYHLSTVNDSIQNLPSQRIFSTMFLYIHPSIIHHQSSNFQPPIIRQRIPFYGQRLKFSVLSKVHLLLLIHQHNFLGRLSVVLQTNGQSPTYLCKSDSMPLSNQPFNLKSMIFSRINPPYLHVYLSAFQLLFHFLADTIKPSSYFHHNIIFS